MALGIKIKPGQSWTLKHSGETITNLGPFTVQLRITNNQDKTSTNQGKNSNEKPSK